MGYFFYFMNTLIGKKIAQKQMFLTDGTRIPVTVVDVMGNTVLDLKTVEKNGYGAVQLGYGAKKKSRKSLLGHVKKANLTVVPAVIKEVRVDGDEATLTVGEVLNPENVFKAGDIVKVTGTSKGKGFAGVMKRHNFRGGPKTHGQSDRQRAPGSIGQTTTPGRVYRGKKMAGRMGQEQTAIQNLQIVDVTTNGDRNILLVKGLVPGSVNSIVTVEKTGELSEKKFVALLKEEVKTEEKVETVENNEVAQVEAEQAQEETTAAQEANVEPVTDVKNEEVK